MELNLGFAIAIIIIIIIIGLIAICILLAMERSSHQRIQLLKRRKAADLPYVCKKILMDPNHAYEYSCLMVDRYIEGGRELWADLFAPNFPFVKYKQTVVGASWLSPSSDKQWTRAMRTRMYTAVANQDESEIFRIREEIRLAWRKARVEEAQ